MAGSLRKRCEWAWCQVQSGSFAVCPQVAAIEKALPQGQITPTKNR
ncbi:Outer membrane receptor protein [Pseudomonas syringae pv. actinidiae]|uniref:Outer membrane receptor protein n=1 Tax=Pseudomonas syringae pv. actinidiae TaxID=103796 RepID=A0AAN4QD78_PSESF|nr:Outer membrane receptor protein [Pseudomonas syringae pv. actinidiae]